MIKHFTLLFLLCLSTSAFAAGQVNKTDTEALKTSLAAFFAAQPSANGAIAELIRVKNYPEIHGQVRWSLPTLRNLPGRISIIAEQGQGKTLRRWYVAAQVKWMKNVVTLKQDISARTVLDRSMITQTKTNIAGIRGKTWSTMDDVIGLKSLSGLSKGDVVRTSVFKRPPLIKRGDHVTILVKHQGIQIRAEGIALKSGSRGDRMLVKNISSKQTLQSIVKDAHTVSIHMGGV